MQALPLNQIPHRIIACNRQSVLLPVKAIDQIEKNLGLEIGWLQLVNIIPK